MTSEAFWVRWLISDRKDKMCDSSYVAIITALYMCVHILKCWKLHLNKKYSASFGPCWEYADTAAGQAVRFGACRDHIKLRCPAAMSTGSVCSPTSGTEDEKDQIGAWSCYITRNVCLHIFNWPHSTLPDDTTVHCNTRWSIVQLFPLIWMWGCISFVSPQFSCLVC